LTLPPYIEVYKVKKDYNKLKLWQKLISFKFYIESVVEHRYKIFIPQGSIREEYSIDLQ